MQLQFIIHTVLHPQITMAVKTTHREKKGWTETLKSGILFYIYECLGNIQLYSFYPNLEILELGILKKKYSEVTLLWGVGQR